MGLGLYICRQIVEQHGGSIGAEFPDAGGTRFVVIAADQHGQAGCGAREPPAGVADRLSAA